MKCKVSLQRKRFHMQGFEWVSVSPSLYPLPRGKWVRRPRLDGLWSAAPGMWRSERRELCCSGCCDEAVEDRELCEKITKDIHQTWEWTPVWFTVFTCSVPHLVSINSNPFWVSAYWCSRILNFKTDFQYISVNFYTPSDYHEVLCCILLDCTNGVAPKSGPVYYLQ